MMQKPYKRGIFLTVKGRKELRSPLVTARMFEENLHIDAKEICGKKQNKTKTHHQQQPSESIEENPFLTYWSCDEAQGQRDVSSVLIPGLIL